jgi:hypothetical protein
VADRPTINEGDDPHDVVQWLPVSDDEYAAAPVLDDREQPYAHSVRCGQPELPPTGSAEPLSSSDT